MDDPTNVQDNSVPKIPDHINLMKLIADSDNFSYCVPSDPIKGDPDHPKK